MPVRITGRHVEITKSLRDYIDKKLPRIEKYTDRIQSLEVVVEKDSYNHKVELRMKAGPITINANVQDPELLRAIDLLIDKVERQLSKKSQRLRERKRTTSTTKKSMPALLDLEEAGVAGQNGGTAVITKSKKATAARTRERRAARVQPILAENVGVHIFQRGQHNCKTMDLHEAAEELFFTDENFLCFQNEDTRQLAVMYRRQDGNFGMIELQAAT